MKRRRLIVLFALVATLCCLAALPAAHADTVNPELAETVTRFEAEVGYTSYNMDGYNYGIDLGYSYQGYDVDGNYYIEGDKVAFDSKQWDIKGTDLAYLDDFSFTMKIENKYSDEPVNAGANLVLLFNVDTTKEYRAGGLAFVLDENGKFNLVFNGAGNTYGNAVLLPVRQWNEAEQAYVESEVPTGQFLNDWISAYNGVDFSVGMGDEIKFEVKLTDPETKNGFDFAEGEGYYMFVNDCMIPVRVNDLFEFHGSPNHNLKEIDGVKVGYFDIQWNTANGAAHPSVVMPTQPYARITFIDRHSARFEFTETESSALTVASASASAEFETEADSLRLGFAADTAGTGFYGVELTRVHSGAASVEVVCGEDSFATQYTAENPLTFPWKGHNTVTLSSFVENGAVYLFLGETLLEVEDYTAFFDQITFAEGYFVADFGEAASECRLGNLSSEAEHKTIVLDVVTEFEDMTVDFNGTPDFPATATVSLSDGTTADWAITWDLSDFSTAVPNEYVLTASFTDYDTLRESYYISELSILPQLVMNVTVEMDVYVITEWEKPADIEIEVGGEYTLPTEFTATIDGETVTFTVTWNGTVNRLVPGEYTLTAVANASSEANFEFAEGVDTTVTVTVVEAEDPNGGSNGCSGCNGSAAGGAAVLSVLALAAAALIVLKAKRA